MRISENGFKMIKSFEGCRLVAYKPIGSEKYYTIGFGHYGQDVTQGMRISQDKAESLLENDLKKFETYVSSVVKVPINQNQFDALVSFTYNVGESNLASSTLLKLLNEKDYKGASNEFPKWIHDNGVVLQGLVKRREAERELFLTPVKPIKSTGKPYIVKEGDNLTKISKKYHTTIQHLMDLNPSIKNPNVIDIGQKLNVPLQVEAPTTLKDYQVVRGDNLTRIAERFNTSVKHLMLVNPEIKDKNKIYIGQKIKVPNR